MQSSISVWIINEKKGDIKWSLFIIWISMSELEIYYSEQELDHIDQLIETQVSKQLD